MRNPGYLYRLLRIQEPCGYARMHARKASCIGCMLAGGVGDPPVREWQFLAISEWMDPATTDDNVAWARETFAAMLPFTANQLRYMNYLDEDDMRGDPTRTAYGPASGLSAGTSGQHRL